MQAKLLRGACALLFLCAPASTWAGNGDIGLFFDSGGRNCEGRIPCSGSATLYVYALLQGASSSGITGAEYGLQIGKNGDADPGWMFEEHFTPDATAVVGRGGFYPPDIRDLTPHRNRGRGINVAWPSCQTGDGTKILIETVTVTNEGCTEASLDLLVVQHDVASNQYFRCPLFTLCDAPDYTKVCLGDNLTPCQSLEPPYPPFATCSTSGRAMINAGPSDGVVLCRVTGVERSTWSSVKGLYRR